jgi:hypothetical protein
VCSIDAAVVPSRASLRHRGAGGRKSNDRTHPIASRSLLRPFPRERKSERRVPRRGMRIAVGAPSARGVAFWLSAPELPLPAAKKCTTLATAVSARTRSACGHRQAALSRLLAAHKVALTHKGHTTSYLLSGRGRTASRLYSLNGTGVLIDSTVKFPHTPNETGSVIHATVERKREPTERVSVWPIRAKRRTLRLNVNGKWRQQKQTSSPACQLSNRQTIVGT